MFSVQSGYSAVACPASSMRTNPRISPSSANRLPSSAGSPATGIRCENSSSDGDLAVVLQVRGKVHGGHAASAELALEAVAVIECGCQPLDGGGHEPEYVRRIG